MLENKEYRVECKSCHSTIKFFRSEAAIIKTPQGKFVAVSCPCCFQQISAPS